MNITENPVFAGLVRVNNIDVTASGYPTGWHVRERIDNESKRSSLELGIYTDENGGWVGVSVANKMKNLFTPVPVPQGPASVQVIDGKQVATFKYYQVPREIAFGVTTITSKNTGRERPLLVEPDENNPAVLMACYAYSSGTAVISHNFVTEGVKVLKRAIDKERTHIIYIAFVTGDEIKMELTEGIPNGTFYQTIKGTFNSGGSTFETDNGKSDYKIRPQFINMPMYIEVPKDATKVNDSTKVVAPKSSEYKKNLQNKSYHKVDNSDSSTDKVNDKPNKTYRNEDRKPYKNTYGKNKKNNKFNNKKNGGKNRRGFDD